MTRRFQVAVLSALVALGGLAAPAFSSDYFTVDKSKNLDPGLKPAPGKALIVFARSQSLGRAVKVKLYADGKILSFVMANTYVVWEGDPGKHEFAAAAENAGILDAEVEADRVYVVQVAIHAGVWKARTHFDVARSGSEALGDVSKDVGDLHPITTTSDGLAWVAENDADFQATIAEYKAKGEETEKLTPADGAATLPWAK